MVMIMMGMFTVQSARLLYFVRNKIDFISSLAFEIQSPYLLARQPKCMVFLPVIFQKMPLTESGISNFVFRKISPGGA
jgi:hypothetical protein